MLTWCQVNDHIRLFKELPIITEITLTLMTWKAKSDATHCECLYLARIIASPFNCWPATQVFPGGDLRNSSWTIFVLLCLQKKTQYSKKNLKNFIHTGYKLFTFVWEPMTNIYKKNIRSGSEFIHTGSKILIPDPKSFISTNSAEDLFVSSPQCHRTMLSNFILCRIRMWSES